MCQKSQPSCNQLISKDNFNLRVNKKLRTPNVGDIFGQGLALLFVIWSEQRSRVKQGKII
jgi:hypothetical protein